MPWALSLGLGLEDEALLLVLSPEPNSPVTLIDLASFNLLIFKTGLSVKPPLSVSLRALMGREEICLQGGFESTGEFWTGPRTWSFDHIICVYG